jgi:hypothetical protein
MGHTVVREVVATAAVVRTVLWVVPVSTEIQPVIFVTMFLVMRLLQHAPNLLRMGVLVAQTGVTTVSGGSVVDLQQMGVAMELQEPAVDTRVAPEHRVAVSMAALVGHITAVLTKVMITGGQELRRVRGVVSVSSLLSLLFLVFIRLRRRRSRPVVRPVKMALSSHRPAQGLQGRLHHPIGRVRT